MSNYNQEQERLKRLRDRQIADRDPGVKQREFNRKSVERAHRAYKPLTAKGIWSDIPHIYKGAFYGLLIGLAAMFGITYLWDSKWALLVSIGVIVFSIVMGLMFGRAVDLRDDIKYNLR